MTTTAGRELTSRRKADRAVMAGRIADLAREYGLAVVALPEQAATRKMSVAVGGPYGLRLTVDFDGASSGPGLDVYVLNWHGLRGARFNRRRLVRVNPYHGHKATDVVYGFDELYGLLRPRFASVADGSAFILPRG